MALQQKKSFIEKILLFALKRPLFALAESMPVVIKKGSLLDQLPRLNPLTRWPHVDIITVNYNGADYLNKYITAIKKIDYPRSALHYYFVDNNSTDSSAQYLAKNTQELPRSMIYSHRNLGFTGGNNIALRASLAKYVLLLNPDTVIDPKCLKTLVMRAEQERGAGIVEAAQWPHEHPKFYNPSTQETSWCSGAGSLILRSALQHAGLFDETFFMYVEDVDLSWRMWSKGYRCIYEPRAKVWHKQSLKSAKGGLREYYLGFRNGLMMRLIYKGLLEYIRYAGKMLRIVVLQNDHPPEAKIKLLKALAVQPHYFRHAYARHRRYVQLAKPCQAAFFGWDYHIRRK